MFKSAAAIGSGRSLMRVDTMGFKGIASKGTGLIKVLNGWMSHDEYDEKLHHAKFH